jgi:hypothetical protein
MSQPEMEIMEMLSSFESALGDVAWETIENARAPAARASDAPQSTSQPPSELLGTVRPSDAPAPHVTTGIAVAPALREHVDPAPPRGSTPRMRRLTSVALASFKWG